MDYMKLTKKELYFVTKILVFTKLPHPIPETGFPILNFMTIPCIKIRAQGALCPLVLYNIFATDFLLIEKKTDEPSYIRRRCMVTHN